MLDKKSWSKVIETTEGPVELSSYTTSDGSTNDIEKGSDYYKSQHNNESNDRDVCLHDHNSDGTEDKTWFAKSDDESSKKHEYDEDEVISEHYEDK
ncbi:hypothetical protein N7603_02140 [Acholeplasma vituli]|uniref:Uncharacterized protein n=1 Tax=Paracholeplasma vituli TaxID=69473 RepID=A0ABT2PU24_9MOLU|nr:hypothetical protein [Paracholeplasma vituli]MCU0104455.1 hypothetical protein [Paracholeplasma vituli]